MTLCPFEDPQVPAWLGLHKENRHWVAFLAMGRAHKQYLRYEAPTVAGLLTALWCWADAERQALADEALDGPALFAEHAATLAVLKAEALAQGVMVHHG